MVPLRLSLEGFGRILHTAAILNEKIIEACLSGGRRKQHKRNEELHGMNVNAKGEALSTILNKYYLKSLNANGLADGEESGRAKTQSKTPSSKKNYS